MLLDSDDALLSVLLLSLEAEDSVELLSEDGELSLDSVELISLESDDALLSVDERESASKLKVEEKKQQYIITRGVLRQRLGLLTNIEPEDFVFEYLSQNV